MTADFNERYRIVAEPAMRRAELGVIGADYGASSYTTREQADRLADLLSLTPGSLLLDVGSGAGWPGLYLGLTTGCSVVLTDLPLEGLKVAAGRAQADGTRAAVIASTGGELALRDERFDAATSSDVLC